MLSSLYSFTRVKGTRVREVCVCVSPGRLQTGWALFLHACRHSGSPPHLVFHKGNHILPSTHGMLRLQISEMEFFTAANSRFACGFGEAATHLHFRQNLLKLAGGRAELVRAKGGLLGP